jgi:lipopolysaccharide export system protein LptA
MGNQKMARLATSWQGILRPSYVAAALLLLCISADAQVPATGFTGLSGDNAKKPIDIESDRLEVDDKKQIAIFIGNVSATQGDYNVRSPRLEVTYEHAPPAASSGKGATAPAKPVKTANTADAKPAKTANTADAGDPLTSGQISFIHATGGSVLVTSSKDEQTATGDDAIYDVKAQQITMTGKKVTLSQKKNVVQGRKLVIHLDNGQAIIDPDEAKESAENRPPEHTRVRALLMPQKEANGEENPITGKKKAKTPDKAATTNPAASSSGWQAKSK